MSSTISKTVVETIPKMMESPKKIDDKQLRLVRSSSIEKIKRFNTFICSQHYYVLPALLSWLKSSQNGLETAAEKTILFFRSVLFNTFFYRFVQQDYRSASYKNFVLYYYTKDAAESFKTTVSNFYLVFSSNFESTFLLKTVVYFVGLVVYSQLLACIYFLVCSHIPYGLVFLLAAWCYINVLYCRTLFFFLNKNKSDNCKINNNAKKIK